MALRKEVPIDPEQLDDVALARRASEGDANAFEVLYRRHAEAAWRMAQAIAPDPEDAADAVSDAFTNLLAALAAGRLDPGIPFRPYLLVATRNAAIDQHRRRARIHPEEALTGTDHPTSEPGPPERAEASANANLLCDAFRTLPERWRTVLWMTEVEGIPARDVGARLGLTPNSAAQLARRAREGLRDRYLQAHLRLSVVPECSDTVAQLGAFTAGSLSPRASARIEQHLEHCPECRRRADELSDVGRSLRAIPLPIPLGLGAGALARYRLHFKPASTTRPLVQATERLTRSVAVSTAVLLALGLTTAGLMSGGNGPAAVPGGQSGGSVAAAPPTRLSQIPDGPAIGSGGTPGGGATTGGPGTGTGTTTLGPTNTSNGNGAGATTPNGAPGPTSPPPPNTPTTTTTPPKPGLGLTLAANVGLTTASAAVSLSGGCTGISLAGSKSCAPAAPTSPGLTLTLTTPLGTIKAGPAVAGLLQLKQ